MLKKLQIMDEYPLVPLKMILAPDWDVFQALYNELKWFPQQPTIDWIESHQDDNPNSVPPITVQLNIHTDELATISLNNLPPKLHVPLDPLVKIQLNFDGGTITRNIPSFLRERLLLPPLRQQYVERFGQTTNEFDDIDWDIFRPVYKKWAKKKLNWTHKFSIRNLSCSARMAKQGCTDPIECRSCRFPIKNDDPLFQCPK